jgi:hypothetical protein
VDFSGLVVGGTTTTTTPATDEADGAVEEVAAPAVESPATPGVAMATSVDIDIEDGGTSFIVYLMIVLLVAVIAFGPPLVAARLRPSEKR